MPPLPPKRCFVLLLSLGTNFGSWFFKLLPTLFRGTSVLKRFHFVFVSEQVVVLGPNPRSLSTHTQTNASNGLKKDGDAENEKSLGEGD